MEDIDESEERGIKDGIPKSRLSDISNKIFENLTPLGASHVITGIWAKLFTIFIVAMVVITFALIIWYFVAVACTQNNMVVSGLGNAEDFVDNFLSQSTIRLCDSAAQTRAVAYTNSAGTLMYQNNQWFCCSLGEDRTRAHPDVCSSFNSLYSQCSADSPSCWSSQFTGGLIQISYAQCTSPATAFVNTVQIAQYIAVIVCVCYLAGRVAMENGFRGLFYAKNWKRVFNNAKQVERAKKVQSFKEQSTKGLDLNAII